MTEYKIRGETKEEYLEDAEKYFGKLQGPATAGPSIDDPATIDRILPSKEVEFKMAERFKMGFGKSSRSGAFSKPNAGPAIFPNSLKFASDFIDEMTPGKYEKPQKPFTGTTPTEQTGVRHDNLPKPAAIITEICMDCMKPIDYNAQTFMMDGEEIKGLNVVVNFGFITQTNTHMLQAMGMKFGDPFCSVFHATCVNDVKKFRNYQQPLVRGGSLLSDKDRDAIMRWKHIFQLHDGQEITTGQWMQIQRLERIAVQTQDYLIEQRKKGNKEIWRYDRKEE
jgi:hypothetical protein